MGGCFTNNYSIQLSPPIYIFVQNREYSLDSEIKFSTISELIEYYIHHDLPLTDMHMHLKLTVPL